MAIYINASSENVLHVKFTDNIIYLYIIYRAIN